MSEKIPREWPESVYLDGNHTEVKFPADKQAPKIGVPESWHQIFRKHRNQGKFPYMYDKLCVQKENTVVGEAFRRLMQYVFDDVVFDVDK